MLMVMLVAVKGQGGPLGAVTPNGVADKLGGEVSSVVKWENCGVDTNVPWWSPPMDIRSIVQMAEGWLSG